MTLVDVLQALALSALVMALVTQDAGRDRCFLSEAFEALEGPTL